MEKSFCKTAVTAICVQDSGSEEAVLFGSGSYLSVFSVELSETLACSSLFSFGERIHGIVPCKFNLEPKFYFVFGAGVAHIVSISKDLTDIKIVHALVSQREWILSIKQISSNECDFSNKLKNKNKFCPLILHENKCTVAVLCAYSLQIWDIELKKSPKLQFITKKIHAIKSRISCLIKSAAAFGNCLNCLSIASGTTFEFFFSWNPKKHLNESVPKNNKISFVNQEKNLGVRQKGTIFDILWIDAGSKLCTVSNDRSVRIWGHNEQNNTLCELAKAFGHRSRVLKCTKIELNEIARAKGDVKIATGDDVGDVFIWRIRSGYKQGNKLSLEILFSLQCHRSSIWSMASFKDTLLTGCEDGSVKSLNLSTVFSKESEKGSNDAVTNTINIPNDDAVTTIKILNENSLLIGTTKGTLQLYTLNTKKFQKLYQTDSPIISITTTEDPFLVFIGTKKGDMLILNSDEKSFKTFEFLSNPVKGIIKGVLSIVPIIFDHNIYLGVLENSSNELTVHKININCLKTDIKTTIDLKDDKIIENGKNGKIGKIKQMDKNVIKFNKIITSQGKRVKASCFEIFIKSFKKGSKNSKNEKQKEIFIVAGDTNGSVYVFNLGGNKVNGSVTLTKIHGENKRVKHIKTKQKRGMYNNSSGTNFFSAAKNSSVIEHRIKLTKQDQNPGGFEVIQVRYFDMNPLSHVDRLLDLTKSKLLAGYHSKHFLLLEKNEKFNCILQKIKIKGCKHTFDITADSKGINFAKREDFKSNGVNEDNKDNLDKNGVNRVLLAYSPGKRKTLKTKEITTNGVNGGKFKSLFEPPSNCLSAQAHSSKVNDIRMVSFGPGKASLLFTTGEDGEIRAWQLLSSNKALYKTLNLKNSKNVKTNKQNRKNYFDLKLLDSFSQNGFTKNPVKALRVLKKPDFGFEKNKNRWKFYLFYGGAKDILKGFKFEYFSHAGTAVLNPLRTYSLELKLKAKDGLKSESENPLQTRVTTLEAFFADKAPTSGEKGKEIVILTGNSQGFIQAYTVKSGKIKLLKTANKLKTPSNGAVLSSAFLGNGLVLFGDTAGNICVVSHSINNMNQEANGSLALLCYVKAHQCGTNSIDVNKNGEGWSVFSAGDDQTIAVTTIIQETSSKSMAGNAIKNQNKGIILESAKQVVGFSAIRSLKMAGGFLFSVSLDQRISMWKIIYDDKTTNFKPKNEKFKFKLVREAICDIHFAAGMAVKRLIDEKTKKESFGIVVAGKGLEVLSILN